MKTTTTPPLSGRTIGSNTITLTSTTRTAQSSSPTTEKVPFSALSLGNAEILASKNIKDDVLAIMVARKLLFPIRL